MLRNLYQSMWQFRQVDVSIILVARGLKSSAHLAIIANFQPIHILGTVLNKINEIKPREQVGADTQKRYDYQYHRAAEKCLSLLQDDGITSVLCEWHDDYVTEAPNGESTGSNACVVPDVFYSFYQVKTREDTTPWDLEEFFGIYTKQGGVDKTKTEIDKKAKGSFFGKQFLHDMNFQSACSRLVFVTNIGISKELRDFLDQLKSSQTLVDLASNDNFKRIEAVYTQVKWGTKKIDSPTLFRALKKLDMQTEAGRLATSVDDFRGELSKRVMDLSEIDLRYSEAVEICRELVEIVRIKSTSKIAKTELPLKIEDLRNRKAILVRDVLNFLSLSDTAYRTLRESGDKDIVKTLSRFGRVGKKLGWSDKMIEELCPYKVKWDIWFRTERLRFNEKIELDFVAMRDDCQILLRSPEAKKFTDILKECDRISKKYVDIGASRDLICGFILSIIATTGDSLENS